MHLGARGDRASKQASHRFVMKYLHTMVRVSDVDRSLDFYCN
jgi:hypothetical protein